MWRSTCFKLRRSSRRRHTIPRPSCAHNQELITETTWYHFTANLVFRRRFQRYGDEEGQPIRRWRIFAHADGTKQDICNWSYSARVLCKFQLHKSDMSYESCASVLHKPQSVDVIVNPTSMAHRRSHGENTRPLEWSVSQMVQHKWSFLWFLPSSKGLWITEQSRCWILVDCSNCIIYPGCGTFPRSNFTKRRLEDRG
jgi:hypothetical protein